MTTTVLSRPELNGTYGKISDQNESGRFNVQLEMEVKSGQGTTFILSNRFVAVKPHARTSPTPRGCPGEFISFPSVFFSRTTLGVLEVLEVDILWPRCVCV